MWFEKLRKDYIEKQRGKAKELNELVYTMSGLLYALTSSVIYEVVQGLENKKEEEQKIKKEVPLDLRDFVIHGDIPGLKYRIVSRWGFKCDRFTISKDWIRYSKIKEILEKILKMLNEDITKYLEEDEKIVYVANDALTHLDTYIRSIFEPEEFYRNAYYDYASQFPEAFAPEKGG
ncbi:MAG: hypothetical protein QXP55_04405 [Nitrososphaerales archaeon]